MALIYSRAEEVFVCFDDDEEVNQYFDRVSELMFDYGQAWREWNDISSRQGQPLKAIEANPIDDFLIVDFVDTTWWYRVWTAQEFLLARSVKFFFFGERMLSAEDLSDCISYFEQPKVEVGVANPSPNGRPASLSVNGSMLLHTTNIKRLIRHRNINLFEPEAIDALDLVAFSRYRGGSDLRDKVYAFAGLSSSLQALITTRSRFKIITRILRDLSSHLDGTWTSLVTWLYQTHRTPRNWVPTGIRPRLTSTVSRPGRPTGAWTSRSEISMLSMIGRHTSCSIEPAVTQKPTQRTWAKADSALAV